MVDSLNNFELSILETISNNYPFLRSHIPFLRVRSRENTGVGMYVNFFYLDNNGEYQSISSDLSALSSSSQLQMDGLKYGLTYEVAITHGQIDVLEIVTNGEDWDGIVRRFWFE